MAQTTKSGYVFLFDRAKGKPLFPIEYRKFPPSDLDREERAPTQPIPVSPPPFARQQLTADMLTQRTPEAHQAAIEKFKGLRSHGQFVPASREGTIIFPGFDGGAEWGGPAYDPQTGLLYVNSNEMAWILRMIEQKPETGRASGRSIYQKKCASCHGPDRKGSPPEFPSLVRISKLYEDSDLLPFCHLFRKVPDGCQVSVAWAIKVFAPSWTMWPMASILSVRSQRTSQFDMKYLSDGNNKFLDSERYPAIQPPWGTLNAIDLTAGQIVWKIPLGEYPELAARGMTGTGTENYGGPVVTAGGLLFIAATNFDKKFRAFDKATGKLLWETTLPAAGNATPSTYEVDGRRCRCGRWGKVKSAIRRKYCRVCPAEGGLGPV